MFRLIDKIFFDRKIRRDKIGLGKDDIKWLRDHSAHLDRIMETVKGYIKDSTFNSVTVREHQRRKDWYDCLTTIQNLCRQTKEKSKINWLTGKPSEAKQIK